MHQRQASCAFVRRWNSISSFPHWKKRLFYFQTFDELLKSDLCFLRLLLSSTILSPMISLSCKSLSDCDAGGGALKKKHTGEVSWHISTFHMSSLAKPWLVVGRLNLTDWSNLALFSLTFWQELTRLGKWHHCTRHIPLYVYTSKWQIFFLKILQCLEI